MIGLLSMEQVNSSFYLKVLPRAFLIAVICLSLVAFTSYTAPKAQAEAISFTLTTAFIMLVIAVMGTLGVTLVSSSDSNAVDYMSVAFGQFLHDVKGNTTSIPEYLSSIGLGAIGLLGAPIHGAISIGKVAYDLIAEFCTWFFGDKEVVSGGDPVGELPTSVSITTVSTNKSSLVGSASFSYGVDTVDFSCNSWRKTISYATAGIGAVISLTAPIIDGDNTFTVIRTIDKLSSYPSVSIGFRGKDGSIYSTNDSISFNSNGVGTTTLNPRGNSNVIGASSIILWVTANYSNASTGSMSFSVSQVAIPSSDYFTITPSDVVIAPPPISVGQTYNVPAEGVTDKSSLEDAIPAAIAPITTTGGLSNTGTVVGSAVPAEYEWLYEDTQAIRNNTNPHFDFIPSALGFDFTIWHYVVDMMNSVNSAIALFGSFVQNMPSAILVFPFGVFALCITVALFRRFLS